MKNPQFICLNLSFQSIQVILFPLYHASFAVKVQHLHLVCGPENHKMSSQFLQHCPKFFLFYFHWTSKYSAPTLFFSISHQHNVSSIDRNVIICLHLFCCVPLKVLICIKDHFQPCKLPGPRWKLSWPQRTTECSALTFKMLLSSGIKSHM